jgi:hypothetical protein
MSTLHLSRSLGLALAFASALATGCLAPEAEDDSAVGTAEQELSGCGVTITKNTTDDDYCGFITVKNSGKTTVEHWTVDFDLPSGVKVDYAYGVTYSQSGTHVKLTPKSTHATLAAAASFAITYCNSNKASLLAQSPVAKSELCTSTTSSTTTISTTKATTAATNTSTTTTSKTPLGKYVMTWYSFQDNTPVNSALSASGRRLIPYVSVALPFRMLEQFGGKIAYGDQLYVEYLAGRTMPNGTKHSGWVQVDDFCGDSGDDSYCFQTMSGKKYPNVDLYIGDFTRSGMSSSACSGPAGSGQQLTSLSSGDAGSAFVSSYGGRALGTGTCGDSSTARSQQGSCWDYTPPSSTKSMCGSCTSSSCSDW